MKRTVRLPDGRSVVVDLPDNATPEQIDEFLNSPQFTAVAKPSVTTESRQPDSGTAANTGGGYGLALRHAASGTKDLLVGAGKGVIDTGATLAKAGSKLVDPFNLYGTDKVRDVVTAAVDDPDFQAALEGENPAENAGKFAERAGEFIAGGAVARGVIGGVPVLARAAASAPRAAAIIEGGVTGAAVSSAQGGDPAVGAALGAAVPAAAPLVKSLSTALKESAVRSFTRTLGATKETLKNVSDKVVRGYPVAGDQVPGLIERGIIKWTRRGLSEHAAREVDNLGEQIDNLWSAIPEGQRVPAQTVRDALKAAQQELALDGPAKSLTVRMAEVLPDDVVKSINAQAGTAVVERSGKAIIEPAAVRNLQRIERMIETLADDAGSVDVHQLRRVKQIFDDVVAGRGGYAGKTQSIADQGGVLARKEAANAIREELAAQYPDIAKINRQFHFWRNVQTIIDETLRRTSSQSQPMGQQLARVAGSAAAGHGGAGAAILTGEAASLFRKITTSAGWNTTSAFAKDRLAGLLASGQLGRATLVMQSMLQASATSKAAPQAPNDNERRAAKSQ